MRHKIEIFSAGCKTCKDAIEAVRKLAGSEHEVVVRDMHQHEIASRAAQHGVRSLPAVMIDGKLAVARAGASRRTCCVKPCVNCPQTVKSDKR